MSKNNKSIKDKMIKKYGKKCFIEELGLRTKEEIEQDLLKYKKSKRKELQMLTFHHIRERCKGGQATEENGAILRNINHIWFNSLSRDEQARINKLFIEYKNRFKSEQEINILITEVIPEEREIKIKEVEIVTTPELELELELESKPEPELILPVHDISLDIDPEEYKKYIELRRKRQREKWKGHVWGVDDRSDNRNDDSR